MLQQKKMPHLSIFAWCNLRKAINMNSAKHVQSALIAAPRKRRATWMLKVTVPRSSDIDCGSLWSKRIIF